MGVSVGETVEIPVANPTINSAKRAMSTSFGSNCYGSLLIAVIQTLHYLADRSKLQANEDRDNLMTIIYCCLECILQMIGDLLEYFNRYAFAQVAIYGKDYFNAAKDTWHLCKSRGVDAIINDSLIGNVLGIGNLVTGLLTCVSGLLYFSNIIFNLKASRLSPRTLIMKSLRH